MSPFKKNIKLAYIISFLTDFNFHGSVWLFFYLRYLSFAEMGIIFSIEQIVTNLLEVPTGAFADIVGKRISIFLSYMLYGLAYAVQAYTTTFWGFLVLALVKSLSMALYSGSFEALTYDTFKEHGKLDMYKKYKANSESLLWTGLFLSSVIGGFLYDKWFQLPLLLTAAGYFIVAFLALFLHEPRIDSQKYSFKEYIHQNFVGMKELFHTPRTTQISLILATISAGYFIASNFLGISQAKEYGLTGTQVGILFGIGFICAAIASQIYPKLHDKLGDTKMLIIIATIVISSFLFARNGSLIMCLSLIVMRIMSSSMFENARSNIVNAYISSKNRATSLSTLSLIAKIPYALGAYFIGMYIDNNSANSFAFLLGIGMIGFLIVLMVIFRMNKMRRSEN
jgi:MFS family permease